MISNNDIVKITEDCKLGGYDVKVRDISFVLLSFFYEDEEVAYRSVFSGFEDRKAILEYASSPMVSFLTQYMKQNHVGSKVSKSKDMKGIDTDELTFDENKSRMIRLIQETEEAMASGEVEKKDGLKIIADLRVKLNDRFNVKDEIRDNLVVVEQKYNSVCACGREICVPTKEDLMAKYNLVERIK